MQALLRALDGQADEFAGVWPDNAATVSAFVVSATQWRAVGLSTMDGARLHYIGLDYAAARVAIDAVAILVTPELWQGLMEMEAAARDVLNRMSA